MIRVEFKNNAKGAWSHEMTTNVGWCKVLREVGIPIIGRIAVSGVDRGILNVTVEPNRALFEFLDVEDITEAPKGSARQTHNGPGYIVSMSGAHLAKHEEDEEL